MEIDGRKLTLALGCASVEVIGIAAGHLEAEFVEAQTAAQHHAAAEQGHRLLQVGGAVGDVRVIAGVHIERHASFLRVQADVDLVVVKVGAGGEQRLQAGDLVRQLILRVGAFDQARIVLLDGVAVQRVVQEEGEVGEEVEQGPGHEAIHLEHAAVRILLAEVGAAGGAAHAAAIVGVDVAEAVQAAGGDFVQRNLARRVEIVPAGVVLEAEAAPLVEPVRDAAGQIVARVAQGRLEGSIGVRALVGEQGVAMLQFRAETEEAALAAERSALHAYRPDIRHAFARANVHHAEAAEIAILRAERAVDDVHAFHQFRSQALERPEVALAVPLRALILLHIVHQDFESAADAAVIEVEAEAADLQGFPPAFVLPGVDAGIQDVKDLVVAGEESAGEDFRVAAVDARFDGRGGNDDGGLERLDLWWIFGADLVPRRRT